MARITALCLCLLSAWRSCAWIQLHEELQLDVAERLDRYAAWHAQAATKRDIPVFIWRPENGVGDQLQEESLPTYLHYCIMSSPQIRFEVAPATGAANIGAWGSGGLAPRLDLAHNPERSKQFNHTIVGEASGPCGGCAFRSRNNKLLLKDAVLELLLRPSAMARSLLTQALPPKKPSITIGFHLRTYVLDETKGSIELDAGPAKRLFDALVAESANCVLSALKAHKTKKTQAAFVASDYSVFAAAVQEFLKGAAPNLTVSTIKKKPVHSNRVVTKKAKPDEYAGVWATWFGLLQADHLCSGLSMFPASLELYRRERPQTQTEFSSCLGKAFTTLTGYTRSVRSGRPANLQTLAESALAAERRTVSKANDRACFTEELKKELNKFKDEDL